MPQPLLEACADLPDPRIHRTRWHALPKVLFIALCATLCGADSFTDIENWGRAKKASLRERLALPNGIPSDDTFNRVFSRLDPEAFTACFIRWTETPRAPTAGPVVALDGKTLRHSFDQASGRRALHVVSAWAAENELVLGQLPVDEKSNEMTALPALLQLPDVRGCIVTTDALGCQREIARQIVEQGGDYVLALKNNQPTFYKDVQSFLDEAAAGGFPDVEHATVQTRDWGHGRREERTCWVTGDVACLGERVGLETWAGLASIGVVESRRRAGGPETAESVERRSFISSLPVEGPQSAVRFAHAVRAHWGIESRVHWVLDVAFREDDSRVRVDHGPANLATLRHQTLNLLRREKSAKVGVKGKRLKAGWDNRYLERVLTT
jgi:predicted transposase YbfD/YdcC